jgi:predicted molibdopterin-dependent oxidoreductase YjgC
LYLNFLGSIQKTKKVLFNVGNSRDDWKIINAIVHFLGFDNIKISTTFDIISSISKTTPFILYKNSKVNFNLFNKKKESQTSIFYYNNVKSTVNNFYLSNSITRNSKIMSLSYSRFKSKNYNFF